MPVLALVLVVPVLTWVCLMVSSVWIDEAGLHQMKPRYVWSRVPQGYAGVVRRRRSVWVRPAGARVGQPLTSLTLVSTAALQRRIGPIWIATPDGGGVTATGSVGYHITDPAEFSRTAWARWPVLFGRLMGTAVAEAIRNMAVDPRNHPEAVEREARHLLQTHLGPQGIAIDKLQMAFVTGTPEDLAERRREAAAAKRSSRRKALFADAVAAILALWFVGVGVAVAVDGLRTGRPLGLLLAVFLEGVGCLFAWTPWQVKRRLRRAMGPEDGR